MQSVGFRLNFIPARYAEKLYAARAWILKRISASGVPVAGQASYLDLKISSYLNENSQVDKWKSLFVTISSLEKRLLLLTPESAIQISVLLLYNANLTDSSN